MQEHSTGSFFSRATHSVRQALRSAATAPATGAAVMVPRSELVPLRAWAGLPDTLAEAEPVGRTPLAG